MKVLTRHLASQIYVATGGVLFAFSVCSASSTC